MRNRWNTMRAAVAAMTLVAGAGLARANTDGLVLRAAGFFQAESSSGTGTCTIPTISSGIPYSSDTLGLWNTFGVATVQYPQTFCDGWLQLQNNMIDQGVAIEYVDLRLRVAGAKSYRQYVPTRNGWPTACKSLRHSQIFSGAYLYGLGTDPSTVTTGSGQPNVAFVNLYPMVNAQVIECLREQYASLPTSVLATLPVVIRAVAHGTADNGSSYKSNPNQLTVNFLHLCGNGRVEFGEQCDPNASNTCNLGPCDVMAHTCSGDDKVGCTTDADCSGSCIAQGDPEECNCLF